MRVITQLMGACQIDPLANVRLQLFLTHSCTTALSSTGTSVIQLNLLSLIEYLPTTRSSGANTIAHPCHRCSVSQSSGYLSPWLYS